MLVERYAAEDDPPWLKRAFREVGTGERTPSDNPAIVGYHAHTHLGATNDETPWCSSFCCWVFDNEGFTSTASAASLSWLRWGRVLEKPTRGCVVIFERRDKHGNTIPNRGHCGFWLGEDVRGVWVLGGNQRNQVGVNRFSKSAIVGYRWPSIPTNSSTNIASVAAACGTVVTAAPSVKRAIDHVETSADTVLGLGARVSALLSKVLQSPDSLLAMAGLLVVIGALWHIVRERNKKIRRLGI